jgi:hypothetical protein
MKRTPLIITLAVATLVSIALTVTLYARRSARPRRERVWSPTPEQIARQFGDIPPVPVVDPDTGRLAPGITGSMGSRPLSVEVEGRQVAITGSADIHGNRGMRYCWMLRIRRIAIKPADRTLLHENYYLDGVFAMPEGQSVAQPLFADTITLPPDRFPPGEYDIELTLGGFAPDLDLRTLKRGEAIHLRALGGSVSSGAKVEITD